MTTCPHKLRATLPPLTSRIAKLPIDERGYPIPFFVAYVDGLHEFRLADPAKFKACVKQKLCWVCGEPMGIFKSFVVGPMCCINRTAADPPAHLDCAEWSVKGCPFLIKPQMERRQDDFINSQKENGAGIMIERNPGVIAIWTTRLFRIFRDPANRPLLEMGKPEHCTWWRAGREATRDEILDAIRSGLPFLRKAAQQESTQQKVEQALTDILNRELWMVNNLLPK